MNSNMRLKNSCRLYDIKIKKENGRIKLERKYYTLQITKDGVRKKYIDADDALIKVK